MYTKEHMIEIDGHRLLLRNAAKDDASMLISHLKQTCGETRFLSKEPHEITLTSAEEQRFINEQNASDVNVLLLGFWDEAYVGNCSLMGNTSCRQRHRASVGIALYQKYTGMGIGTHMMDALLEIARDQGFEQLELEVVSGNKRAISLYQKLGFEIFGTFPHHMKYPDGTYADVLWMMKRLL